MHIFDVIYRWICFILLKAKIVRVKERLLFLCLGLLASKSSCLCNLLVSATCFNNCSALSIHHSFSVFTYYILHAAPLSRLFLRRVPGRLYTAAICNVRLGWWISTQLANKILKQKHTQSVPSAAKLVLRNALRWFPFCSSVIGWKNSRFLEANTRSPNQVGKNWCEPVGFSFPPDCSWLVERTERFLWLVGFYSSHDLFFNQLACSSIALYQRNCY